MIMRFWIIISIAIILIVLGILFVMLTSRKKEYKPDYYSFFVMGIIWVPFGIIFDNKIFLIMGIAFIITGLINKKKWEKNRKNWKNLDKTEKRIMIIIISILLISLILGVVVLLLKKNGII